ncbi:MAG: deoxyhypusine synthase family protein [Planctomycetota bacterium]
MNDRPAKHTARPVIPFDPEKARSANDILTALGDCSFQGRALSIALDVLETMATRKQCGVVLTFAGAMIPAGMGEIVCRLMERGVIQAIVSTGANISHDMVNAAKGGHGHYLGDPNADDDELYRHRINRIYDTNLPEENYGAGEELLDEIWRPIQAEHSKKAVPGAMLLAPSEVFRLTGAGLSERGYRSMMSVAYETETPIFCGATSDSEFCLNLAKFRHRGWLNLVLDEQLDLFEMAEWIKSHAERGTIIVGGGVPRNWAQQVFPLLDMIEDEIFPGYDFGVRICTDNVVYGGMSGCTMSESKSWGKYGPGACFAEVSCDATIALPILCVALFERLRGVENSSQ